MRRRMAALAVALPLLLSAACGGSAGSGDATKTTQVTVGVIPILDVAPIYLGVQQGFFKQRGLDVKLESGQGGAAIVPGVVSGQFQFGFSNVTSLLVAASKKLPLKMVVNGVASTGKDGADFGGVLTKENSGITDAAGLAGKRVAVNTLNNIGTTTIRESVRQAGGDPNSVRFVELPFPDMPAALDKGNVDAIWVVEPFFSVAKGNGAKLVASNYVDAADDLTVATYFTSKQYAGKNADVVKRFVAAMRESLKYADANPDAVRKVLLTYTKIDKALVAKLTLPKWPTEVNKASVEKLAALARSDGLIKDKPDLAALLP
jgi:NitT/TauT family transport system substrate-binding protein